ncbi:Por secretion system C-terminal sorting domain-containing protein [Hymenobacter gelipurpurascens]|uniref:Por secretion system C-terminal sorting domain-containing protein n=1 Tax=Hymenobacter gelipurpurascens TaxID=89968 RepID=A0A212TMT6_9BACT|nr:T9SS type A sorting domain-containing protein [Hymenobacter gelipurpurascens]SNC67156.1 Por secretion system C-terminal sorting domain-containing protein [Hymenobacter gelipurpurascens]
MQTKLITKLGLLLAVLFTSFTGWAQATQNTQGTSRPARRAVQAYVQQNVLPVVRQQRQKLEPQLSSSDKAQLAVYRSQFQELRQRGKALRQSFRPAGPAPQSQRPELTETQKQQLQKLQDENKALQREVAKLAQKYEGDIARLSQEIQPQKEKWATDLKALLLQNTTPEQQEKMKHFGRKGRRNSATARFFRPSTFLLMNPTAPAAPASRAAESSSSVYPNPVTPTSQLSYEVKKAGPVSIELLDSRGNTLRTVAQEAKKEKGTYTVPANLSDLANGIYYFKIVTKSGTETRRFVKE